MNSVKLNKTPSPPRRRYKHTGPSSASPAPAAKADSVDSVIVSEMPLEPTVARDIVLLQKRGGRFYLHSRSKKEELGEYAAYKALTSPGGTSGLSVSLGNELPPIHVKDRANLKTLMTKLAIVDSMVTPISQKHRDNAWKLLFSELHQAQQKGDVELPKDQDFWNWQGWGFCQLGLYERVFQKIPNNHRLGKLAFQTYTNGQGKIHLKTLGSAFALFRTAFEEDLELSDYMTRVVSQARAEDRDYLTRSLGRRALLSLDAEVPNQVWQQLENGELTVPDIKEVMKLLAQQKKSKQNLEIGVEDNLIVVGDEELEVDL